MFLKSLQISEIQEMCEMMTTFLYPVNAFLRDFRDI